MPLLSLPQTTATTPFLPPPPLPHVVQPQLQEQQQEQQLFAPPQFPRQGSDDNAFDFDHGLGGEGEEMN